ncbi:hypothetical protein D3C72_988640 [compost metagenome]
MAGGPTHGDPNEVCEPKVPSKGGDYVKQFRDRKPGDADPADLLRHFVALAMCPEYQARRLAEEAKRQAEQDARRLHSSTRKDARR